MLYAVFCPSAAGAGDGSSAPSTQDQIAALNAAIEQVFQAIPPPGQKVAGALIDKVYTKGTVPVIVRLSEEDQPFGIFVDKTAVRSQVIGRLQRAVLEDVLAHTPRKEAALHVKRFQLIPAIVLQVDPNELETLTENPNVIDIVEDIPVPLALQDSVPLLGADPDDSFGGYTGDGWTVAILDTGVDKNHPFLTGKVVSEACYSSNYPTHGATSLCPGGVTASTAPNSGLHCTGVLGCNHGTHVAGIAAGKGSSFSGVARDASIIAIQVFSRFDSESSCGVNNTPCLMSYVSDQMLA